MNVRVRGYQNKTLELLDVSGENIFSKNLEGREQRNPNLKFSTKGKRSFGLTLPDDLAKNMAEDGWTVKFLDDPEREPVIFVKLNYNISDNHSADRCPKVYLCTDTAETYLDARDLYLVDDAEIERADLIINRSLQTGSAYLEMGYFYEIPSDWNRRHPKRTSEMRDLASYADEDFGPRDGLEEE